MLRIGEGTYLVLAPSDSETVGKQAGGDVAFFLETDDFAAAHARMVGGLSASWLRAERRTHPR